MYTCISLLGSPGGVSGIFLFYASTMTFRSVFLTRDMQMGSEHMPSVWACGGLMIRLRDSCVCQAYVISGTRSGLGALFFTGRVVTISTFAYIPSSNSILLQRGRGSFPPHHSCMTDLTRRWSLVAFWPRGLHWAIGLETNEQHSNQTTSGTPQSFEDMKTSKDGINMEL